MPFRRWAWQRALTGALRAPVMTGGIKSEIDNRGCVRNGEQNRCEEIRCY